MAGAVRRRGGRRLQELPPPEPPDDENDEDEVPAGSLAGIRIDDASVETEDEGFTGKIRRTLSSISEAPSTGTKRGRSRTRTSTPTRTATSIAPKDFSEGITVPLMGLAMVLFQMPQHLRMTKEECDNTALPLTRILLRHVSILNKLSEDLVDGFAIVAALTAYAQRISHENALRQRDAKGGKVPQQTQQPSGQGVPSNEHVRNAAPANPGNGAGGVANAEQLATQHVQPVAAVVGVPTNGWPDASGNALADMLGGVPQPTGSAG